MVKKIITKEKPTPKKIKTKVSKMKTPTLQLKSERDIAMDFAQKAYTKFDKMIKAVVLFGSAAKHTNVVGSDIDIIIILDNAITAMTGMQKSLAVDEKLVYLVKGLGVNLEHIKIIKPLPKNHSENVEIIGKELDYRGLSVVIAQRECIHIL